MSMQIVFEQILIIFGYVIVGYVAGKKNLITKEQQRYLSTCFITHSSVYSAVSK